MLFSWRNEVEQQDADLRFCELLFVVLGVLPRPLNQFPKLQKRIVRGDGELPNVCLSFRSVNAAKSLSVSLRAILFDWKIPASCCGCTNSGPASCCGFIASTKNSREKQRKDDKFRHIVAPSNAHCVNVHRSSCNNHGAHCCNQSIDSAASNTNQWTSQSRKPVATHVFRFIVALAHPHVQRIDGEYSVDYATTQPQLRHGSFPLLATAGEGLLRCRHARAGNVRFKADLSEGSLKLVRYKFLTYVVALVQRVWVSAGVAIEPWRPGQQQLAQQDAKVKAR